MANSKRIEEAAVAALKMELLTSPILESFINSNDKTPSWDGYVLVYENELQKKSDLIGRVPIQIKGTENWFHTDEVPFSCNVVDLQNYNKDGGCIFFLVSVNLETKTHKIFYTKLLNDVLDELLKNCADQKTCTIRLKYITQDAHYIENIFKTFLQEKNFDPLLFTVINENFLTRHRVTEDEANDLITNFSSINGDPSLVLKIVCNDLHVHTPAYDRIVEEVYMKTIQSEAPTFLMADGGTGKSTLLCSVATYAYKVHKIQVLYSNYDMVGENEASKFISHLKNFVSNTTGLTLLCMDKSLENKNLFVKLYAEHAYGHTKNNLFKSLRVLIADRTYNVVGLFWGQLNSFSLWTVKSRALLIANREQDDKEQNSERELLKNFFAEENIITLYFNREIQQTIIEEMIYRFSVLLNLDRSCVEKAKQDLISSGKTISDILLDFRRKYNNIAQNATRPITKIDWDWDIWNRRMKLLYNGITPMGKIPPKYTFRYIAALILAGVNVSINFLEHITGIALSEEVCEVFPEGLMEPVHIIRGSFLRLRHDTVAANYFEINPNPSCTECLKKLIDNELFDSATLIQFEKKALSITNIYNYDTVKKNFELNLLLQSFNNKKKFRTVLAEKNRLYSLELALIAADVVINKRGGENPSQYYENRLETSFEYVFTMVPENARYYKKATIWIKYFRFAARTCETVPPAMLRHLLDNGTFYISITEYISGMLKNLSVWIPDDQKQGLYSCALIVFKWIIDNIDHNDVPSRIHLSQIYLYREEYDQVRKLYKEFMALPPSKKRKDLILNYIGAYEKEAKSLEKEDINNPRICQLRNIITELYQEARQRFATNSEEYISTICRFARFKKNILLFNDAYALLEELTKEKLENWRLYNELGMLYNTYHLANPYYDLKRAILCFNTAWNLIQEQKDRKKEAIYILKPLAMTYMSDHQFEKAIEVCNETMKYYENEPQIKKIKELAQKFLMLPPKDIPLKWWKEL